MITKRRKLVAVIAGFLTFLLIGLPSLIWGQAFSNIADKLSNKNTEKVFRNWRFDTTEISNFYFFFYIGLAISLGFLVTFIIWDFRDKERRRLLIYIPLFVLILGFSVYNYLHFDYIIQPDIQVIFNLIIILLGLILIIKLWTLKTSSLDLTVLKYFSFFILLLVSVIIPFIFNFLWLIQRLGVSKLDFSFNMPIITTISGTVTAIVTFLKYRDEKLKAKNETA